MEAPTEDLIKRTKAQFPDRSMHQVEAVDEGETYYFLMTGPDRIEYKKFNDDVLSAKETKEEKERVDKIRVAVENSALAQIRWPERDEVKKLFASRPALSISFADEIHKAAGSNIEVRSKKL